MQHDSPILNSSSKITFSVIGKSMLPDKCLGRFDIDMEELLQRQCQQADDSECLRLLFNGFHYD
jgi:hypothetical protein